MASLICFVTDDITGRLVDADSCRMEWCTLYMGKKLEEGPKKQTDKLPRSVLLQQLILISGRTAKLLSFDSAINKNMEMSWLLASYTTLPN